MHEAIVRRQRVQTVTRRVLYSGKRFSREPWGYVAVSNRGDLAWEGPHVVLRPAGQRARVVGDDGILLAFEDERTLRWNANDGLAYHDVRAPHMRDGCPSRQRFAPLAQSDQVLVTLARYGDAETNDDERTVARVCLRGAGGDHVVDQASTNANGEGTTLGVAGVDGPWAVLTNIESSRVGSAMTLRAVHAGTGATARRANVSGYASDIHRPDRDTSAVVTDAGIPAWISTFHDQASLFVVAPNGQFSLLGTGPAGTITDLRSDGPRIAWTQAGEPHTVLPA